MTIAPWFVITFGVTMVLGGLGWAALVWMASGMADRATTREDTAPALWGLLVAAAGAGLIIWGANG